MLLFFFFSLELQMSRCVQMCPDVCSVKEGEPPPSSAVLLIMLYYFNHWRKTQGGCEKKVNLTTLRLRPLRLQPPMVSGRTAPPSGPV